MKQEKHVAPLFVGVFAADTLPRTLHKLPALIVCNTDPISKPGSHWVAFFINENRVGEFWDSYGMPPLVRQHRQFLNRVCKQWTYNHRSLQAIDSDVCGEYCILYLVYKAHGFPLRCFVSKLFSAHAERNDVIVRRLFKNMFGKKRACILPQNAQRCCARKK